MDSDGSDIRLERATLTDCQALASTSKLAFDSDVDFGAANRQ